MKYILDWVAYIYMQNYIKQRPLDINIETVSFCPMKCIFCCNRLHDRKYTVMNEQLFERIVQEYVKILGGGVIGIGSMQSDLFSDPLLLNRIKTLRKYGDKLWVHSTTPLITCKKYSDKELIYILSVFSYLEISVEGYDEESYLLMGGIDGFRIFKEQVQRVKRLIDENHLKVKVELSFRTCDVRALKGSSFYRELKKTFPVREIRNSFFSWFGSIKKEELPRGAYLKCCDNSKKGVDCMVPNATLAVQASGKVVGCGCIDWLEKYIIGDCNKMNLREIWQGKRARDFRQAFSKGKLPSICKECGLYISKKDIIYNKKYLRYTSKRGLYYLVE